MNTTFINTIFLVVRLVWSIFMGCLFIQEKDKFRRIEYLIWFGIAVCI